MSYGKRHEFGFAGLALLRNWLVGKKDVEESILEEISRLVQENNEAKSSTKITNLNVSKGYTKWADTYDTIPNLLIDVEEPVVQSIIKAFPRGKALDAACGTGRYSQYLQSLGFTVTGLDISSSMLAHAKKRCKDTVAFLQGDVTSIPLKDNSVHLAVCALALTHFQNLTIPLSELARVVMKGNHIIISDIHPWLVALGGQAEFFDGSGNHCYINNYIHWHSSYMKSFAQLGLKVVDCIEPVLEKKHLETASFGIDLSKNTISSALMGLPISLIWVLEKN